MYYADLTKYQYWSYEALSFGPSNNHLHTNVVNIGWLEMDYPFSKGSVAEEFIDRLFELCCHPTNKTRGFHVCSLCTSNEWPCKKIKMLVEGEYIDFNMPQIMKMTRNEIEVVLGHAEIWVPGENGINVCCS